MLAKLAPALLAALAMATHGQQLVLPFEGRWFVAQGGDTPNVNHHMAVRAQWYGIDFAKTGGPGGRSLASVDTPAKPEHFFSWNAPVTAPAAGRVVSAVDEFPDNPLGVKDVDNPAGNHVVIRTAAGTHVFLAHLRRDSIAVRAGDTVSPGAAIGRVGNSGNSDFPHLHLHMQDTAAFDAGTGLNPFFTDMDVELTGKRFRNVTWPLIRGLFVQPRQGKLER